MTHFSSESRGTLALRAGLWMVGVLACIFVVQRRAVDVTTDVSRSPAQQGAPNTTGDAKRSHGVNAFGPRMREEDWKQAEAFFQAHAPHYLAKVEKLNLPENRLRMLHATMAARVQTLQSLNEHFPELYEVRVRQLELFDALLATRDQYATATGSDKQALSGRLKQQVSDLLANALKDRQTRVTRLKEMLGKLQETVERDTQNLSKTVETRYQRVLDHGVDASFMDNLVEEADPLPTERGSYHNRPTTLPSTSSPRGTLTSPTTVP